MSFITIIQPDETFTHHPTLPDGGPSDTVLTLKVLSDAQTKALRKKHTKHEWVNGQRLQTVDGAAMADDMIDAALVGWTGVQDRAGKPLPCERALKLLLPERVQVEIVRLCAGKEAGFAHEGEVGGNEGEAPSPGI
jgi:hypothetical protein